MPKSHNGRKMKAILKKNASARRAIHRFRRSKQCGAELLSKNGLHTALSANFVEPEKSIWLHWSDSKNFGDDLSRILCEDISGRMVINSRITPNLFSRTVYSGIGSVLQWPQASPMEIWGSGFIYGHAELLYRPQKVHCVRGALTRDILVNQGFNCPKLYGDPAAIFFDRYADRNRTNRYKIGLIPHYADKNHKVIKELCSDDRVKLIDVFDSAESIVRQSLECELIASSSLHGLILADTLEIPNYWLRLNGEVVKDGFKFYDYFSSVQRIEEDSNLNDRVDINSIIRLAHLRRTALDLENILDVCPFQN
jgi:pyruvyltransferase|tara:strand:- start:804 stop:1733 length:930 start_codon:yes stop_codon:yes gene_type:complete